MICFFSDIGDDGRKHQQKLDPTSCFFPPHYFSVQKDGDIDGTLFVLAEFHRKGSGDGDVSGLCDLYSAVCNIYSHLFT